MKDLFEKYDVPAPRYTSYPTVPYWEDAPSEDEWFSDIAACMERRESTWSMYVHLPFCESRCTFCGCNTIPTNNHDVEGPYCEALLAEMGIYLQKIPGLAEKPVRQLHLGGGTPTFFSAEKLKRILEGLLEGLSIDASRFDASIEVNPGFTTSGHLTMLRGLGFRRISIGVQDLNPAVQKAIGRGQSREATERVLFEARSLGFDSVNFDLIFGLPLQTPETMADTAAAAIELRPDRIALYSLALVPWIRPAHKKLVDSAPTGMEKRRLYEVGREAFLSAGYIETGMDHFALPSDSLARAMEEGTLHRNFMGYTDMKTDFLLALGVSSISQSPGCFHQNIKELDPYTERVLSGRLATARGHVLNAEDRARQRQILSLMTCFEAGFESREQKESVSETLKPLIEDHLIEINGMEIHITGAGRPFLRNVCMAFDERLKRRSPQTSVFSQAV